MTTTAFRTCPLCEATCGLELQIEGDRITRVRGDADHVLSHGFLCPKGAAYGKLVEDPDRVRRPMVREGESWREVTWPEAFAAVEAGLRDVVERHGSQAVAAYAGNPNVHTLGGGLFLTPLLKALRSTNLYSASTVDQMPKHVSCGLLFGDAYAIPVPDLDRTDHLLMLGANPLESNGSLCTAPDFPGRMAAIQGRGGRIVVVDPRRTKTAEVADEHVPIRPGADAFLLFAMVQVLFADGLVGLGSLDGVVSGLDELRELAGPFTPEAVAERCGIPAERIRELAHELAAAPTAVVYGRIGTCTVEYGTLTSWLVDVVNALTGNLDSPGGAMFPLAPHGRRRTPGPGRGFALGRWASRVRGLPEVAGQLPVATLQDEIEGAGDGQVRALITVAGNPVLSTPNSERLDRALASLDFMVSVDPYLNETTRHAHVLLPPTESARVGHYDVSFLTLAVRNVAVWSAPSLPADPGAMDDAEIIARLTLILEGKGADADPDEHGEALLAAVLAKGDVPREAITGDTAAERLLDGMLRTGAYGLTLDELKAAPHGIDLGPLQPRIHEVLRTASGTVELCPEPIVGEAARLRAALADPAPDLVLVGRRHLRSNNSWMHNVRVLVKGKARCTLQVHPDDAVRRGLADGAPARITSRVGSVVAPVEITDAVMPGVASLPHGWGHDLPGTRMEVAAAHAGVNANVLTDECVVDPLSGNAVLNGIPIEVAPA